ncbi:alpha/beta fold hydrolase [Pandoraea anhela]|uniref:Alpha/beta hydrolase n=1 Tax=Pandoraea anhela TaxID=2508295 RepID=A0A5E4X2G8_9BURK|nr:alpha/beta hydrolase [Pandoraea anhela]VVE30463.1 alpha/beta hydrolase [Pandoraea anhela]
MTIFKFSLKPLRAMVGAVGIAAALHAATSSAAELWQTLPPTPAPAKFDRAGFANVNGIRLYNAEVGKGSPVLVLHGGLANSDYLARQVDALKAHHRVIAVDTRGHGRSTRDDRPYGYDLMADDVVALLDQLHIKKADVVGWSDGAIQGIDLAMRYPDRVGKIVAFGVNTNTEGLKPDFDKNPVFAAYIKRAATEYTKLSSTPKEYDAFLAQIGKMWDSQPNWTDEQLKTIKSKVLILDGEHDEGIKLEHNIYMAHTIPGAQLMILPGVSHFAFIQDPKMFNYAITHFLDN